MRLFVAVDPPAEALADLRRRLPAVRSVAGDGIRWGDPELWHLTLTFLGEVGELPFTRLGPRLARAAARHPPFTLALTGGGAFPRRAAARVLWCGLSGDVAALVALAGSTGAAARRSGLTLEERRYRPHLTLGRTRSAMDVSTAVEALSSYAGPSWTVDRLHLVRSRQGPPTMHERIASWPLGRARGATS